MALLILFVVHIGDGDLGGGFLHLGSLSPLPEACLVIGREPFSELVGGNLGEGEDDVLALVESDHADVDALTVGLDPGELLLVDPAGPEGLGADVVELGLGCVADPDGRDAVHHGDGAMLHATTSLRTMA